MKCDDFGSLYDYSLTIEQNIKEFKNYGVRTTSRTLKTWLEENGIPYKTDKDVRNGHVIRFYKEDPNRSSREIETLCKEQGIDISYRTIQRILRTYNKPEVVTGLSFVQNNSSNIRQTLCGGSKNHESWSHNNVEPKFTL